MSVRSPRDNLFPHAPSHVAVARLARPGICGLALLAGCDLMHLEQKLYCARATPEECQARPDWCHLDGGARCVGPGPIRNYCRPAATGQSCVRLGEPEESRACPRDRRFLEGGTLLDLETYAAWLRVGPETMALAGTHLTADQVEAMPTQDRRALCGTLPDEPCELTWDDQAQLARCTVLGDPCAQARWVSEPLRCIPLNLCNGVICP